MKYNTYTLPNGMRVIHLPSASQVVYCGYGIKAGARDEQPGDEGLAHFCEHTTFKGTARRKSIQILNCLESVGGDINAFTNKEDTVFYSAILKDHLPRAIDLLTDIVFHSTYPQHEIDKEIEVICDEIECYNDSPSELIYDEFENMIFEGSPLGHNILGNAGRLRQYTTADALRFTGRHYRPANAVFFAYGDVDFRKLSSMLEKAFGKVEDGIGKVEDVSGANDSPYCAPVEDGIGKIEDGGLEMEIGNMKDGNVDCGMDRSISSASDTQSTMANSSAPIIQHRGTHQAHVMIGSKAYNAYSDKRMALYLLNNILGGPGMNARLNIALRERNGLVYTVDSSMTCYSDTGLWCTYFGCDPHDVKKCLRLVHRELDKMMQKQMSVAQLNKAKKQIKGQLGVASDNRESFALDFGKTYLHYGREKHISDVYRRIDELTPAMIQDVAQEIFNPDSLTTLIFE